MPAVTIPYSIVGKGEPVPLLKFWVRVNNLEMPFVAMVDSGADRSTVPYRLAGTLKLKFDANVTKTGLSAGGPYTYYPTTNSIFVRTEVGMFRMERPHLNPNLKLFLFGRCDFFASFRVTLDQKALTMTIERYADEGTPRVH